MDDANLCDTATVREFLERAAADTPTPGGGGIAALTGAAAVSMLEMALNFTVGRPKFREVDTEARALLGLLRDVRGRLVDLVARDAAAYSRVAGAMRLPAATPADKSVRRQAVAAAMREAVVPPADVVRAISKAVATAPRVLAISNRNLHGDVAVAAAILPGAADAAAVNVWLNLSAVPGSEAEALASEIQDALSEIHDTAGTVFSEVKDSACRSKDSS